MKRRVIIDTDPGIDDAAALAIALHSQEIDVRLITTVCGNVNIDKVTLNTLKLLTFFDKKIKVAKGASEPIIEPLVDASDIHGLTGMEGYEFPEPDTSLLLTINAIEAMYGEIMDHKEKTTIMAIGPLTNVALLLKIYPEVKSQIDEIVFMGGSLSRGNKSVMAEFNAATDPEAMKIVMDSSIRKVMLGLDMGLKALVYPEDSENMKKMNKVGDMLYQMFKKYRGGSFKTGLKMYDSCAIAYILQPELFNLEECYVDVEIQSSLSRGMTLVDLKNYTKKMSNCGVATDISTDDFRNWFLESIQKCI